MTLDEILKYCQFVLAQNQRGNSVSIPQYNILLKAVNIEMFSEEVQKVVMASQAPPDVAREILLNNPLSKFTHPFTEIGTNITSVTLPTHLSRIWTAIATKGTTDIMPITIYTEQQAMSLKTSVLNVDFDRDAGGILRGNTLEIIGGGITQVDISYLGLPATPYYDYVIDTNDNVIYLEADYVLYGAGTDYYFNIAIDNGSSMVVIYSNVYYSGAVGELGVTISPQTVELEWDERFHVMFANKILEKLGVNIRDPQVLQYTQIKKQQGS
jgi:hypothetical protein